MPRLHERVVRAAPWAGAMLSCVLLGSCGMSPGYLYSGDVAAAPTTSCDEDANGLAILPDALGSHGCRATTEGLVSLDGELEERDDGFYFTRDGRTLRLPKDSVVEVGGERAVRVGARVDVPVTVSIAPPPSSGLTASEPQPNQLVHGWWPWAGDSEPDDECRGSTSCVGVVLVCCSTGRVVGPCLGIRDCPGAE